MGALVRADARALHVAGDAEPEVASFIARRRLVGAEIAGADHLQRHVEPGGIVAAVVAGGAAVLEGEAHIPRELVGLDEIASANLGGLEPQLARDEADHPFHGEGAVRAAGPAIGAHGDAVRVGHLELHVIVAQPVRPGEVGGGDDGHHDAVGRVGAGVVDEAVAQGEDAPVGVHGDFHVVDLTALLVGGQEVLVAVLDPLHGPAQVEGGERDQDFLRVEQHDLRAEAAAGVGRDHLHAKLGKAEHARQPILDGEGRLGGVPDAQEARARLVLRRHPAALDGASAAPLDDEAFAQDVRRAAEGAVGIADGLRELCRPVGGDVGVDAGGVGSERGLGIDDGGHRLVLHVDEGRGILGQVATVRHHEGHRFADESNLVHGQGALRARVREGGMRDQERPGLVPLSEVAGREHEVHAGEATGPRGVDTDEPGPRVRAAQDRAVEDAGRPHVVHEAPEPAEESRILAAGHARANHAPRWYRGTPAASPSLILILIVIVFPPLPSGPSSRWCSWTCGTTRPS